ncbi:MAG: hypothetical protein ABGX83_10970 [Nitrospira sp.]|nr:hypothetical protein [Candidatus Manganitrophaceae bacterium]HIL34587.1 hypothetical protein [Candidatus Manganitrophaceae bacterium]
MKRPYVRKTGLILWLKAGLFFALFFLLTPGVQAVQSASKDTLVSVDLDQLYELSRKIIEKAGKKGRAVPMEAAGQTRLLIDHLREIYGEEKSDPPRDLDPEEDALLEKINNNLKRLLKGLGRKPDHDLELTQSMRDTLNPLFVKSNSPRVFSSLPGYHVVHPKTAEFVLTVKGQHLNYHDSHIVLDGKQILPSLNEADELVFSIPTELFQPHSFKVIHKELTLTVYKQKKIWYTLGFTKENVPVEYSLIVYIMPKNLARYSVKIKKMITSVERRSGNGPLWSLRSGGRQDIRRTFSHATENGWKFDPGSAEFIVTRLGEEGKPNINIMVSPDLITVEMLRDGKENKENLFEGHLAYTEWRSIKSEDEEEVVSNKYINWKDKKVITLPDNMVSYAVSIEMFNGLKRVLDGGAHKEDYVKVQYNSSLRRLSLTPKNEASILGK